MKPQETKFTFVYNEIKQSILEGQIPIPGERWRRTTRQPMASTLC